MVGHNCIMIGSPGSGKTMLAKRIPTILPEMNYNEMLETTKIHSISGNLNNSCPIIMKRPFRAPHHSISKSALIGGGKIPKPGEISLAHNGVLFLDELTEFDKSTLESLREPLEENKVNINRIIANYTYPSNFILIAATNPCPCGYYLSKKHKCICSKNMINKYINKISGPLLDRIDIQVQMDELEYQKIENNNIMETSKQIKSRVELARKIQKNRYKNEKIEYNASLTPKLITKYCRLNSECKKILEKSFEKFNLTTRGYHKIIKVARTIADLENSDIIKPYHIAEAIQYRDIDKNILRKD